MQFHTIVSAFYLDGSAAVPDLRTLVERAGMANVVALREHAALGFTDTSRVILGGQWGVFGDTWAVLDEADGLFCLQLYSSFNRFGRNRVNEEEYVDQFATACARLAPKVALLDARAHYEIPQWNEQEGNRDWVLAQVNRVVAHDINALADDRVSVLYLSEPLLGEWQSTPSRDYRETMDVAGGRLIFAGVGQSRMA